MKLVSRCLTRFFMLNSSNGKIRAGCINIALKPRFQTEISSPVLVPHYFEVHMHFNLNGAIIAM